MGRGGDSFSCAMTLRPWRKIGEVTAVSAVSVGASPASAVQATFSDVVPASPIHGRDIELPGAKVLGGPRGRKHAFRPASVVGGMVLWREVAERMADGQRGVDFIAVDGGEGGTGAAPLVFADHVSFPFRVGFAHVYGLFTQAGLSDRPRGSGRASWACRATRSGASRRRSATPTTARPVWRRRTRGWRAVSIRGRSRTGWPITL